MVAAGIPVTVIEDALLLAACMDLAQHLASGGCPDCTADGCPTLRVAWATVDALAPPGPPLGGAT